MENEIVKIALNKHVMTHLEGLAKQRKWTMDKQINQALTVFIGLFLLDPDERIKILKMVDSELARFLKL